MHKPSASQSAEPARGSARESRRRRRRARQEDLSRVGCALLHEGVCIDVRFEFDVKERKLPHTRADRQRQVKGKKARSGRVLLSVACELCAAAARQSTGARTHTRASGDCHLRTTAPAVTGPRVCGPEGSLTAAYHEMEIGTYLFSTLVLSSGIGLFYAESGLFY
jgi:hypothetical protein